MIIKKLSFFLLMVVFAVVGLTLFDQVAHPSIADDIAVSQLENSEDSAMAIRSYDYFSKHVSLIVWTSVFLLGIGLFGRDLVTFFSEKIYQCINS